MKIAITTDTHWGFSPPADRNVKDMLHSIKAENPALLIHCGDYGSTSFSERFNFWAKVRDSCGKDMPIITVAGNHDYWEGQNFPSELANIPLKYKKGTTPKETSDRNMAILDFHNIVYAPDGMDIEYGDRTFTLWGIDGWYADDVPSNDCNFIPKYWAPEGVQWLRDRSDAQFDTAMRGLKESKEKGNTTIFISHFGCTQGAKDTDWKNMEYGEYFGGNLSYEKFLDPVDYYFFGHSHSAYDGLASNGYTRVINAGSNYGEPKFIIMDI